MGSIFSNLRRDEDEAAWVADYGPYTLHSALQPIFSQDDQGVLTLQAFEGLIRPARNGEFVRPGEFFAQVEHRDRAKIDSLCRSLHIFNTGNLGRRFAKLLSISRRASSSPTQASAARSRSSRSRRSRPA